MENARNEKIQEMQLLEQTLQQILMQRQAFQMELSETNNALGEIKKAGDEVFKIVGQLMIKTDKKKASEDLENKKKILDLRTKTLEKQEKTITEKLQKLQEEVLKKAKQ